MDNKNTTGTSFTELLLIAFIVMKLAKIIDWSWWWVVSPLWIHASVACLIVAVMALLNIIKNMRKKSVQ